MNAEKLANHVRTTRDDDCECDECTLAAALLIAIEALKILDEYGDQCSVSAIAESALARIRGETK